MTNTNIRHILTIGLNDQHTKTQKYDTITAYKMIESILTQYTEGYTMYETNGGYKHDDGTFISEKSIRVELMFIAQAQVFIIANKIKETLNQESIAYETITSNSQLI
jgi:hypothetical protein